MAEINVGGSGTPLLGPLGINEQEEQLYRWLLAHPQTSVQQIARGLKLSPAKTQRLLDAIEARGFTTCSPDRPRRYIPTSPDIAIEALVRNRRDEIDRVLGVIPEFRKQVASGADNQELMVELVSGPESQRQVYAHVQAIAEEEMIGFVKLPLLVSQLSVPHAEDRPYQDEAQARGVRYRSIVDVEFLEIPGALSAVHGDVEAGEEVRVTSHLPLKMVIADRRIALVPLNPEEPDSPTLLVRSSALLNALYALFEILWERSSPVSFSSDQRLQQAGPDPQLNQHAMELIAVMVAGLNDKSISAEMGITTRTLQRRVSELMETFGARTRFQAGWLSALRLAKAGEIPGIEIQSRE